MIYTLVYFTYYQRVETGAISTPTIGKLSKLWVIVLSSYYVNTKANSCDKMAFNYIIII